MEIEYGRLAVTYDASPLIVQSLRC